MPRRMSCSMTVDAVRDRSKTVTRRHVDTWRDLKPGDRLVLIEKGMGLPKGARQVVLAEVEIVDVRVEPIVEVLGEFLATRREGLPDMTPSGFVRFWLDGHGYRAVRTYDDAVFVPCRRIEWRYLDEEPVGDSNVVRYLREILDRPGKPGVRHVAAEALEGVMGEIHRLTRERAAALESVVTLSSWQRRAVIAIGALRDELDPDDTDPIWSPLFDLLAEEFGDVDEEDGTDALDQWGWWHKRYVDATGDNHGRTVIEMEERRRA